MPNSPYSKGPKHHHCRTIKVPTGPKITTPSGKYCSRNKKRGYCPYISDFNPPRANSRTDGEKYGSVLLSWYKWSQYYNHHLRCCPSCLKDNKKRMRKKNA